MVDLISEPLLFLSSMEKKIEAQMMEWVNNPARQIEYADYNEDEVLTCPMCGWAGASRNSEPGDGIIEYGDVLLTVECPQCEKMLLIVSYPLARESDEQDADAQLRALAEELVQTRIPGMRKGTTDKPAYTHSFHVRDLLEEHGYSPEVCLAGLLHDIVEDGGVSLEELRAAGFSECVVRLVDLCSHDASIEGTDARWVVMIARLVQAGDSDAWAIKVADLVDNLMDSGTMEVGRREWMRNVKRSLMGRVARGVDEKLMVCISVTFNLESAN